MSENRPRSRSLQVLRKKKSKALLSLASGFWIAAAARVDASEKKFIYAASYLHTGQYDQKTGYKTNANSVIQLLSYRLVPKLSVGGSLTFNHLTGDKASAGQNSLDVWGGSGFLTRSLTPGLTFTGLLGYYKGDGHFNLAGSPSVSNSLSNNVLVLMTALDQFVPLAEKLAAHVGAEISGVRSATEETRLQNATLPSHAISYLKAGLNAGLNYRFYGDFYSGFDLRLSHAGDRSTGGYLALQPEFSLDWRPANASYGARARYGLVRGQQRESYFGGLSLGYDF